ncbi:MAG: hypothetical protein K8J08_09810 [Thermoanaerobaculia bacterium]|nr:hypothetical protein [Thermoanaerobaculia bacterium]
MASLILPSTLSAQGALSVQGAARPDEGVPAIIVIPNVRIPSEGVITGGQPTPEALKSAAEHGYTTIVDLRGEGEDRGFDERALVESLGMRYVAIPISGASDLSEESARELAAALPSDGSGEGMIMVHCASGNRVGALFALKAHYVDGTPAEDALELGFDAGMTGLSDAIRDQLGLPAEAADAEQVKEGEASPSDDGASSDPGE